MHAGWYKAGSEAQPPASGNEVVLGCVIATILAKRFAAIEYYHLRAQLAPLSRQFLGISARFHHPPLRARNNAAVSA
jgi:hypothetical protein